MSPETGLLSIFKRIAVGDASDNASVLFLIPSVIHTFYVIFFFSVSCFAI